MAKTKISEFSSTPSNNTDINGINIAEGCAPSGINNAIRQLMADLKDQQTGASGDSFTVGGNLAVTGTSNFTGAVTFANNVVMSGTVTAPTQVSSDNSTKVATTAYVTAKVAASTSGLSDPGANGLVVRTASGTTAARTLQAGTGISITYPDGVSGNPVIASTASSGVTSVDSATGAVTLSSLSSFAKSLGANGYQKFPGGFTLQWGTASIPANTSTSISLPISYASTHAACVCNEANVDTGASSNVTCWPASVSSMNVTNAFSSAKTIYFISVGY